LHEIPAFCICPLFASIYEGKWQKEKGKPKKNRNRPARNADQRSGTPRAVPNPKDPTMSRPNPSVRILLLPSCFSLLIMTGCGTLTSATQTPKANTNDPLLGGGRVVKPASYTTPAQSESNNNLSSSMPAPSSTKSTAALASGGHPSLDATHDLRIDGGGAAPRPDAWRGQAGEPGIVLNRPEAMPVQPDVAVRNDTAPASPITLTGGLSAIVSFDQAWTALRARGMTWSVLESNDNPNEWKFACWIPNRQNPDIHRSYEASGADPLGVLRAVLAKIDQDR
jgi:hypothetical protein